MSWEYKTLTMTTKGIFGGKVDAAALEQQLNELGRQEWELVSVVATNYCNGQTRTITAILKRRG